MGRVIVLDSSFVRPSDATAYTAGDEVSNSATAGSVVRATFDLSGFTRGRILRASLDVTPASSNMVITAANLDLLIFKTVDVPAAVGDNVAFPVTGAQRRKCVARFLFDNDGWQNTLGAYTADTSGYQTVPAGQPVPLATPTLFAPDPFAGHFDFSGGNAQLLSTDTVRQLTATLQVLAAWNPGAVANTIGIRLIVEAE